MAAVLDPPEPLLPLPLEPPLPPELELLADPPELELLELLPPEGQTLLKLKALTGKTITSAGPPVHWVAHPHGGSPFPMQDVLSPQTYSAGTPPPGNVNVPLQHGPVGLTTFVGAPPSPGYVVTDVPLP